MKKMSKGMLMTALICGAVYLGGSPVYANELQEYLMFRRRGSRVEAKKGKGAEYKRSREKEKIRKQTEE